MEKITKKTVEKMSRQLSDIMEKRQMQKLQKMKEMKEMKETSNRLTAVFLNDAMLRKNRYDIASLERNIDNLSLRTLLYTQYLTPEFCVKYILNDEYASCVEDTYICIGDILNSQKHISLADIETAYRCVK